MRWIFFNCEAGALCAHKIWHASKAVREISSKLIEKLNKNCEWNKAGASRYSFSDMKEQHMTQFGWWAESSYYRRELHRLKNKHKPGPCRQLLQALSNQLFRFLLLMQEDIMTQ